MICGYPYFRKHPDSQVWNCLVAENQLLWKKYELIKLDHFPKFWSEHNPKIVELPQPPQKWMVRDAIEVFFLLPSNGRLEVQSNDGWNLNNLYLRLQIWCHVGVSIESIYYHTCIKFQGGWDVLFFEKKHPKSWKIETFYKCGIVKKYQVSILEGLKLSKVSQVLEPLRRRASFHPWMETAATVGMPKDFVHLQAK